MSEVRKNGSLAKRAKRGITRRALVVNALRALLVLGAGKGVYNTRSSGIEVERVRIELPGLPPAFRGLSVALLSDLHSSFVVRQSHIRRAAELAMAAKPDVIALTGDFVSATTLFATGSIGRFKKKYLDRAVNALSILEAPMGLYAVLGNHEFWSGPEAVNTITREFEKRLRVRWLRNSSASLEKRGERIDLVGIDDYWEGSSSLDDALKGLDTDTVKVLLSHNPDINAEIDARTRIDLILSGHTHGGQVVLPFIGMPWLPSTFGQKYRQGLIRDGERQTYVTRGVGHLLIPLRFNCPPEVSIITLV